ncbi:MerR family transcriptional regulator [Ideonella azotifigens]|uniref:MerR family transcriptional regulator n=2 Tax=Ideonella azotifigens TaxID=513160 RepID=A0ABN1K834_9BURK|nr:MerR family transcriptional regulator [Ideonella azotifigens]MCD2342956.1 MerR family transcriptional regulator [Ideonella azotifigens]
MAALLKVGELARRAGLTVRTLHHYDSIGLLRPSARAENDYRLYNQDDVARLHAIQALQGLGLTLEEVGRLLAEDGARMPQIIERQLLALQQQIRQAQALQQRLELMQQRFHEGQGPELDELLITLQMMTVCDAHFSPSETRRIFARWPSVATDWWQLIAEIQEVMDRGVDPLDPQVQPLAQRWMTLMRDWMQGDFDMMERWGRAYHSDPGLQLGGGPSLAMVQFIEPAVQLRLSLMLRYLSEDDLRQLGHVPREAWAQLASDAQGLMDAKAAPGSEPVRALARRWFELSHQATGGDAKLRDRLRQAFEAEPLLQLGGPLTPERRAFLNQAVPDGA